MGILNFGQKKKEELVVRVCMNTSFTFMNKLEKNANSTFGLNTDYVATVLLGMGTFISLALTNNKVGMGITPIFVEKYLSSQSDETVNQYRDEIQKHYESFRNVAIQNENYIKAGVLSRRMAEVFASHLAKELGLVYNEGSVSSLIFLEMIADIMKQVRPDLVG